MDKNKKSTIGDVLAAFTGYTNLAWYPDPCQVDKNPLWKVAVEKVDDIIVAQARGMKVCHCTAQNQTAVELVSEAATLFERFREWLLEVS